MLTKTELENMEQKLKAAFTLSAMNFESYRVNGYHPGAIAAAQTMAVVADSLLKVDGKLQEAEEPLGIRKGI